MKKRINYSLIAVLKLVIIMLMLSSCIPQKKIKYMQAIHKDSTNRVEFSNPVYQEYHLGIGDNLYIKVRSLDAKSNDFFNNMGSEARSSNYNDASIYLNS